MYNLMLGFAIDKEKYMPRKPKVSVIIPVYNVEKYLKGCLDSLLAQTFKDYEALCVNDGSTDNSLLILQEYADRDDRIKIITQENKGLSGARNIGMDNVAGEYMFFLDSDDYIHPQTLEFLHKCALEHNIELVAAGYKGNPELYKPMSANLIYEDIKQEIYNKPLEAYFKEYKTKLPGMVWTKLYKAELIKDIRFIEGRLYEDEYFTAMVMERCKSLVRLDFAMYNYYYGRGDAITMKFDERVLISHFKNVRFLCEHFANYQTIIKLIKHGKVSDILFGSCLKSFPGLGSEQALILGEKLINCTIRLVEDGLISYKDLKIINRYKLYRMMNGNIPTIDVVFLKFVHSIYKYLR